MDAPLNRLIFNGMALSFRIRDLLTPPQRVLANAGIEPGMTVIDYGCGPGSYTLEAGRQVGPGGRVYGVDIHPLAVESVNRKAARQGLEHVRGLLVTGYDTGLPATCADRILIMDMIHMVARRDALLLEAKRLLKPGGVVLVQVHHMAPEPVRQDLTAAGFSVTQQIGNELLATLALHAPARPVDHDA